MERETFNNIIESLMETQLKKTILRQSRKSDPLFRHPDSYILVLKPKYKSCNDCDQIVSDRSIHYIKDLDKNIWNKKCQICNKKLAIIKQENK